ncbi:MAG: ABC transporter permease [Reinekea sp.]|jgi:ABC-2 type transport system permease protein
MILFTVIQREWQRLMSQPTYWAALFLMPLLVLGSVCAIIKVPQVNDVVMDVVDLDQTSASRDLRFRFDASAAVTLGKILMSPSQALERARTKQSFGYLLIPEGFHQALVSGEQVNVTAFVNQQSYMLGNILSNQVIRNVLQSSIRETTVHLMSGGALQEQALAQVIALKGSRSVLGNSHLNYQSFLLASLLPHLWHVFVMLVTVVAVGDEFKNGTTQQWMDSAGQHLSIALLGKLAIPGLVLGLWISAIDLYVVNITGLAAYSDLSALLVSGWITQFSYHCAGLLAVALTHNYRTSLSLAAFYSAPAFAFVGVTFPTFDMNNAAQLWQSLLPISQLIQIQNLVLHWQVPLAELWPQLARLGVYILVFSLPALALIRRKVSNSDYWYKH